MAKFDPSKPLFYENEPKKSYQERELLSEAEIYSGMQYEIPDGCQVVVISSIYGDYSSGNCTIECYGHIGDILNKNYEKELKEYNKKKEEFEKRLAQWEIDKIAYDKEKAKKVEESEKREYERLRKKFGN